MKIWQLAVVAILLPTVLGQKCSSGWLQYNQQCFLLFSGLLDWHQARIVCQDLGGDLAALKTTDVNSFITPYVAGANTVYWIGLHDITDEGQFTWIVDEELLDDAQNMWNQTQPDNYGPTGEDCVEILPNGNWNDYPCVGYYKAFICEIWSSESPDGISTGGIIGIVIAVLGSIAVVGIIIFLAVTKGPFSNSNVSFDNALYNVNSGSVEVTEKASVGDLPTSEVDLPTSSEA